MQLSMSGYLHLFTFPFFPPSHSPPVTTLSPSLKFPIPSLLRIAALPKHRALHPWLAQFSELTTSDLLQAGEGPIELPQSTPSILSTFDDASPLQAAASIIITGAISVFLFRAVRRRAKRVRELRFRSSGAKKVSKEEALDLSFPSIESPPTSPAQALFGGLLAGMIALILYKFTTTIEASLNHQTLTDNMSVRQITITIRTIITGLCYLATFVYGFISIGLIAYSGQLAINSLMEGYDFKSLEENKSPDDTH